MGDNKRLRMISLLIPQNIHGESLTDKQIFDIEAFYNKKGHPGDWHQTIGYSHIPANALDSASICKIWSATNQLIYGTPFIILLYF